MTHTKPELLTLRNHLVVVSQSLFRFQPIAPVAGASFLGCVLLAANPPKRRCFGNSGQITQRPEFCLVPFRPESHEIRPKRRHIGLQSISPKIRSQELSKTYADRIQRRHDDNFFKRPGHLRFKGVARSARTAPRSLGAGLVDPRKHLRGLL